MTRGINRTPVQPEQRRAGSLILSLALEASCKVDRQA